MPTDRNDLSGRVGLVRRALGYFCLVIWFLGVVLPIIPGWPALILAILLLGRRDRTLRLGNLITRRTLRWLRLHPIPHIRDTGRWLSTKYLTLRRTITPRLIAAEHTFRF